MIKKAISSFFKKSCRGQTSLDHALVMVVILLVIAAAVIAFSQGNPVRDGVNSAFDRFENEFSGNAPAS